MNRFIDGKSFALAIAVFLVSSVVGLIYNSVYPRGIPIVRKRVEVGDTLNVQPSQKEPDTSVVSRALGLEETYALYQSGDAFLLDARPRVDYEIERIQGALSLPEFQFDDFYPSVSELLNSDSHIIVYCQGVDCDESIIVAQRLVDMGFRKVDIFLGGLPEWLSAGYPTDKGLPAEESE